MATNGIFSGGIDPDLPAPEDDAADAVNYDPAGNIKGGPLDDHPELARRRAAVHEIERMRSEHIQKMNTHGDAVPDDMKKEFVEFTTLLDDATAKYQDACARVYGWDGPTEEDFEQLRASVPPAPKWPPIGGRQAGVVFGGGRVPRYGNPHMQPVDLGCAPRSIGDELRHEADVRAVADDLRRAGAQVRTRYDARPRRSRARDRFKRWVISVAEDYLMDLVEKFQDLKAELDVLPSDLDPWPDPLAPGFGARPPWRAASPFDLEQPEYEEEIPFANREYCGIFGRGGLGK